MPESLLLTEIKNFRRFAFCLLGNRTLGDMAVEAALNEVARCPDANTVTAKGLYRKIAEAAAAMQGPGNVSGAFGDAMQRRFQRLPMLDRQIACLRAVMKLPFRDVAEIVGVSEPAASRLYVAALSALREEPVSVLIIEDDALVAFDLRQILTNMGFYVAGTANSRREALRLATTAKPALILADCKLDGDIGTELISTIQRQLRTKVIYVTAHPEIIGAEAPDETVISKPFTRRQIEMAVQARLAA